MVNSSFGSYPGVPIATSQDFVSWQPAGYVLDRPSQLPLVNQPIAHGGIYAPTIRYNKRNKTFYMITTNVGRGNFLVKTKDPSKGWSDPIWLPKVQGIDPDLLFDDDGKAYIVHNASVRQPFASLSSMSKATPRGAISRRSSVVVRMLRRSRYGLRDHISISMDITIT